MPLGEAGLLPPPLPLLIGEEAAEVGLALSARVEALLPPGEAGTALLPARVQRIDTEAAAASGPERRLPRVEPDLNLSPLLTAE